MANTNRRRLCRLGKLVTLSFAVVLPACHTPPWCPTRALRCLPPPADTSAPGYWQECERQAIANSAAQNSGSARPTPGTESKSKDDGKSDKDESATDKESAEEKTEAQAPRAVAASPIQLVSMQTRLTTVPQEEDEKSSSGDESPSDRESDEREKSDAAKKTGAQDKQPNPFQLPSILPGADTPPLSVPRQANDVKGKEIGRSSYTQNENARCGSDFWTTVGHWHC